MKQLSFPTQNSGTRGSTWTTALILGLVSVSAAQAHPGHSLGDYGAAHIASSPYHVSILAAVGLALWLGARFVKWPVGRRVLRAGGIAAVMLAAAWWGVGL